MRSLSATLLGACILLVTEAAPAHALYLDPGTGSLILQVVAAAGLAAWFALKSYAHRIRAFFVSSKEEDAGDSGE